jgi:hypothetical protein
MDANEGKIMRDRPATPADTSIASERMNSPFIFEWCDNQVQKSFQILQANDLSHRHSIIEILEEMHDSRTFRSLMDGYNCAVEEAVEDDTTKKKALMALLARVYIAGTLRDSEVFPQH